MMATVRAVNGTGRKGTDNMYNKILDEGKRRIMLQLFADGTDGGGSDGGDGSGAGSGEGSNGGNGNEPVFFDDFLKLEGNQAEFDRRIQKAVNTAVTKAQEKWKALTDDKLSEAEKLAKMTKEEKAAYEKKQLEKEIAELKKEKEVTELTTQARKLLSDEGVNVPDSLLAGLIREDAEKTNETVKEFVKLFNEAVSEAVKAKARQRTPGEGGGQGSGTSKPNLGEMARKARII